MKKVLLTIGVVAMLAVMLGTNGYFTEHYKREATIVEIDPQGECKEIVARDLCGYEWAFLVDATDEINVGESVVLKMVANGTESNIFDDEVYAYDLR